MVRQIAVLSFFAIQGGGILFAQKDRIVGPVDTSKTVILKGNVRPAVKPELDRGGLDPSTKMTLELILKPSASQQADMDRTLAEQQDPSSPNYHKWLTPDEFANRFGLSDGDIAKIVNWLKSEGFHVDEVARGRNTVSFEGTAAQVQKVFHTEIRRYQIDNEMHFANSTEPSVPAALEPVIGGLLGLDDFKLKRHAGALRQK